MSDDHEPTDPGHRRSFDGQRHTDLPATAEPARARQRLPAGADDVPEPVTDILYSTRPAAPSRDDETD